MEYCTAIQKNEKTFLILMGELFKINCKGKKKGIKMNIIFINFCVHKEIKTKINI